MTTRRIVTAIAIASALACSRATEPDLMPEGNVVLRFESASHSMTMSRGQSTFAAAADDVDSVVVNVFRSGSPITKEASRSAAITDQGAEITIPCIVENGKRVGVDLYSNGKFTHHGFATGVNVVKGANTPVAVDAYAFTIETLSVTPGVATEPEPFDLAWNGAPAATRYEVQSSATSNFDDIEWKQSVPDTIIEVSDLPPGAHYFRVVPCTDFAEGSSSPTQFGYAQSASQEVLITGFSAPEVIPGEVVTIFGENLDYPGVRVNIGARPMEVLSSSWDELEVVVPRAAVTNTVDVANDLGSDSSEKPLIVQRVAYVTATNRYADEYVDILEDYSDDFGKSGVAVIPIEDLDDRDMSVFDVIIVASDTGSNPTNWGEGVPVRAQAIAATGANVLALGEGGLAFLKLVAAVPNGTSYTTHQTSYYTDAPTSPIYTTPHAVTNGNGAQWFDVSQNSQETIALGIAKPYPSNVGLDACTGISCLLLICSVNDRWSLLELSVPDVFSSRKRYVFWGYDGDPDRFTSEGEDLLGNAMHSLYSNRLIIVDPAVSGR